jgi:nitrite reductase/ring-hydroxylating ferredoxin subunit
VPDPPYVKVCPESELAIGRLLSIDVAGRPVLLCRLRDAIYAVDNVCTHAHARLDEGRLRGHRVICPLHGAAFDMRTGAVLRAPATIPLETYRVRVQDGYIEVQAPDRAPE